MTRWKATARKLIYCFLCITVSDNRACLSQLDPFRLETGGEAGTRESFDLLPPVKSEEHTCGQAAGTRGRKEEGRHVAHL